MCRPSLTLVVPCYNEEERLDSTAFLDWVSACPSRHLAFVDDASTDQTFEIVDRLREQHSRISVLSLRHNHGKAGAVRAGMLQRHSTDLVGFWDADLSSPLKEADRFVEVLTSRPYLECVAGIRLMRLGSQIERSVVRHLLGRLFTTAASSLLSLPAYDTQCGAKLFRKEVVQPLFAEDFVSPWLFDVELYLRLRRLNHDEDLGRRVVEHPLTEWRAASNSHLRPRHFVKAPFDLYRIYRRYR